MDKWNISQEATALHISALVWDNHGCMPTENTEAFLPELARYHNAGVNVAVINLGDSNIELDTIARMAASLRYFIAHNTDKYIFGQNVADIERAQKEGKLCVFFNIEGCFAMGDQLSLISFYYDIGVRWMLMVYNAKNLVGYGVHDQVDEGLTSFGRKVVEEMDRVGMVKCCTHTGYRTAMDVFEISTKPTIFSHSNPRAITDHERNIPDELIKAGAASGGVICINGVGIFLGDNDIRIETMVRNIDYVVQLVGPDYVGIGLDFVFNQEEMDKGLAEHRHIWPEHLGYRPGIKFFPPDQLPELTEALLKFGYKESDIRGILGENLLRVARDVWQA